MKIESVKLRGFLGIRKGLSLDELSLDLSGLSGLIALAGPNGKGKSTLLECMTPWRSLASRAGALQHHTFLRDSCKEIIWRWNGDHFRSLIKIDAQSGKSEAYLYRGDTEKPIASGNKNYDNVLRELLGSEELFFSSVFACQGGTKLSDMTTGQLKSLFSEFLRLDRLIAYEETSKAARNRLSDQAAALENERKYLEGETAKKGELLKRQTLVYERSIDKETGLLILQGRAKETEDSLKALRSRVESNRIHEARLKDLQAQGKKIADDRQKEKAAWEREINSLRAKLKEVEGGITAVNLILEKREEIEKAAETEIMLNRSIQAISDEISTNEALLRDVLDEMNQTGQRKVKLESQIEALQHDEQLRNLKNTIASLREKKALLDKKDPTCTSRTCAFIVSALKAEELPTIEKALLDRQALVNEKEKTFLEELATAKGILQAKSNLRANLSANIKSLSGKVASDKAQLQKARILSALKSQLDQATAKLEGLEKRKFDLEGDILVKQNDLSLSEGEFQSALFENTHAVQQAQRQVDPLASADLEAEEENLKTLQASKETTEKEISSLKEELASLESQIRAIEEKETRLSEIQEKRAAILQGVSRWEYIKNACSKDGLRALEIEAVVPAITYETNELLFHSDFGTLKIITQDPETGKEVFWIKVIDKDGDEVSLDWRSGGEQIWPIQALRLGMTLVSKQKSDYNYLSAFSDELDGPLDVENAKKFVGLYPTFMKKGKFESLFFISHKPECVAMADHQILFNGKGIEIE